MRTVPLYMLTWGTAAAAVSSAVWLSSISQATLLCSLDPHVANDALGLDELLAPETAPAAGPVTTPSSDAAPAGTRVEP
jgi:hypothetical protein